MIIAVLLLFSIIVYLLVEKVFPIISGHGAKSMCSNVFVCDRLAEDVIKNDLGSFPLNLAKYTIDSEQKTVISSVWGLGKKKAVYRSSLGATLINGTDEINLVAEKITVAPKSSENQQHLEWPMGNLIPNWIENRFDHQQLNVGLDMAISEAGESVTGTRAVAIVHDGQLVAERYGNGFSAGSKLAGWSMAKSITSALIGILVKQNRLNVDEPAPIQDWKNDSRSKITIANLLQMSSGLSWWEYHAGHSDATNMLFNEKNTGRFAIDKKLVQQPGKVFNYSSGSTNILSFIIRQIVGDHEYHRFPYEQLFYITGMLDTVFELDAANNFVGSSYCFATARDWARFGLLYLNNGYSNGQQILPERWVEFTTTPTSAKVLKQDGSYGAHWWLNVAGTNGRKRYPDVPDDCYECHGYEGQYIWVIPSRKLVIVRLALEKRNKLDPNTFLPGVIKAFS